MELYYRFQRRVCSKEREDISIIKNKKEKGLEVCKESVEKEIYLTIEITINITSILCTEEEWEE